MDDQKPTEESDKSPLPESGSGETTPSDNQTTESTTASEEVVVTTDDKAPEAAQPAPTTEPTTTPQATVSAGPKGSKKGVLVGLTVLVLIVGLAVIGYMVTRPQKSITVVATVTKKDIPLLQVAAFSPLPHSYYPDTQNDNTQFDINMQLFESLTKFENGTTLKPGLADSWTNPDTSTWVFKLHPNVKFHTGKTLAASDVKASIEAVEPTDFGKIFASTIKDVTVVDPLTVKITTNGPDPLLANELTQLFIYDTTSGKANDPINGSGPYTLKSDTTDAIKLVANDAYYGGHVYTREVDYLGYQETKSVPQADLTSRKIQVLSVVSDLAFDAQLKSYGYTLTNQSSYEVGHLVFNTSKAGTPFANVKVRQAVAQALDQKALIVASHNVGATPATQTIANGIPGYNPNIKAVQHSVANAKAALTAAGYPNGFSYKLTYYPPSQALAEEVQKEMATIGVTVKLDPESDQHQLVKIAIGGGTDMYYNVVSSSYVDGSDVLSDFIDSANYTNPALDKLNDQAAQELNQAKRVAILQQMGAMVESDQADMPLFQREADVLAHDPNIVITHDNIASAVGTYFWQTYQK